MLFSYSSPIKLEMELQKLFKLSPQDFIEVRYNRFECNVGYSLQSHKCWQHITAVCPTHFSFQRRRRREQEQNMKMLRLTPFHQGWIKEKLYSEIRIAISDRIQKKVASLEVMYFQKSKKPNQIFRFKIQARVEQFYRQSESLVTEPQLQPLCFKSIISV